MTLNPIPAGKPYAAVVNREYNYSQGLTFESLYNQAFVSHKSDVDDGRSGKMTPNTDIPWDDTTEVQGLISVAYDELGLDRSTLEAEMKENPGPKEIQNFSYAQWGLVPGQPSDPSIEIRTVIDASNGNVISRAVIVP